MSFGDYMRNVDVLFSNEDYFSPVCDFGIPYCDTEETECEITNGTIEQSPHSKTTSVTDLPTIRYIKNICDFMVYFLTN